MYVYVYVPLNNSDNVNVFVMRLLLLISSTSFLFDQFITCYSQGPLDMYNCSSSFELLCDNNYRCVYPGFLCTNNNCIYPGYQCDWLDDCGDLSDEIQCEDVPAGCGGTLQEITGTVMSPNYPARYPDYARCTWIIEGPEQSKIVLNVTSFILEEPDYSTGDCYDWLEFRETMPLTMGDNPGTDGTVKWCGSGGNTYTSPGNYLWLQFVSDYSDRRRGFEIAYRVVTPTTTPTTDTVTTMRTTHKQTSTNGEKEIHVSTKEVMVPTMKDDVSRTMKGDQLTSSKFPATTKEPGKIISYSATGTIILGTTAGVFFLILFLISIGCIAYFRFRKKHSDSKPPKPQSNQLAFDGPYDTTVGAGQSSFFNENAQERFNAGAGNHVNEAFETDNIGSDDTGIYHDINDSNNEHAYATASHPSRQDTSGHDTFALAEEGTNVDTETTNNEGWVENDIYTST